jgi:hypothetical protein
MRWRCAAGCSTAAQASGAALAFAAFDHLVPRVPAQANDILAKNTTSSCDRYLVNPLVQAFAEVDCRRGQAYSEIPSAALLLFEDVQQLTGDAQTNPFWGAGCSSVSRIIRHSYPIDSSPQCSR